MKRPFVVIYGWMTFRRASRLQHARAQPAGKINLSTSMRRKLNSSISPKFTSTVLLNRKVSRQRLRVWFYTCEFFFGTSRSGAELLRCCLFSFFPFYFVFYFVFYLKIWSGVAQMLLAFCFILLFFSFFFFTSRSGAELLTCCLFSILSAITAISDWEQSAFLGGKTTVSWRFLQIHALVA